MMTPAAVGSGGYYVDLAKEDYYLSGGEPPGIWWGRGARDLNLTGQVEREQFTLLLNGYSPEWLPLVKNAGTKDRQKGYDLCFSAPKSVSVLWSQADPEIRKEIERACEMAVKKALTYLEEEVATTRTRAQGKERQSARLAIAIFQHGTSREADPQLHHHAIVINACTREEGSRGAIESKGFWVQQKTAGALYRAELAARLERLGYEVERHREFFQVKGVPKKAMDEFSKRRTEILSALHETGMSGARAAEVANLSTREVKSHVAREALFHLWEEEGKKLGFSTDDARKLRQPSISRDLEAEREQVVGKALEEITRMESTFTRRDLLRVLSEEAQGRGLDADTTRALADDLLHHSDKVIRLGHYKGEERFTTASMMETEKELLQDVEKLSGSHSHKLLSMSVSAGIHVTEREGKLRLNDEQKAALSHITQGEGSIQCVIGRAGTGKTTMLKAARIAWEREDYQVIGAAIAGKAARGLEEGSGIRSYTVAGLLKAIEGPTFKDQAKHEVKMVGRAFLGKDRYEIYPLNINSKTVLVVDEAGMVDTKQMQRLLSSVRKSGAKIVLVGDTRQLQPIEAGGPFRHIIGKLGASELREIIRQKEPWARKAVEDIERGEAGTALLAYAERGLLTVSRTRANAIKALIRDWKEISRENLDRTLILAGTNKDVRTLNRMAQEERQKAKGLGTISVTLGEETFHRGDRVVFTKRRAKLGLENGDLGTVTLVEPMTKTLLVKLDRGETKTVPLHVCNDLKLGYAVTTHRAQGATVDRAFVLLGGPMQDLHLSYVEASRAKNETRLYADKVTAGDKNDELTRQMERMRQKELAVDAVRPPARTLELSL